MYIPWQAASPVAIVYKHMIFLFPLRHFIAMAVKSDSSEAGSEDKLL